MASHLGKKGSWRYDSKSFERPEERDAWIEAIQKELPQCEIRELWDKDITETYTLSAFLHSGENSIIKRH